MKTLLSILFALFAVSAQAQISSTFNADADGWTFSDAGTPVTVNYNSTNGNPGGYVSVSYNSNTTVASEGWFAPAKFLGLQVARSYGMNLHFDLQQAFAGTASSGQGDVRIEGNAGFDIVFSLPVKPAVAPAWSSYTIKLDETGGWRVGSTGGALATKNDVLRALTNIVKLEIRGTYITNANNVSGLDNVVLEQGTLTPAPVVSSVSANSGKPGDIISINGSGFNTVNSSNAVWFGFYGKVKAVVQTATATRLDVVVPQNAAYGPITITNAVTGLSTQTAPFNPVFDGGGRIIPASFKPKFDIPTILIESVSAADVDGDGWIDLAVTNDFTDRVIDIYRNLGTGGTLTPASFASKVSIAYTGLNTNGTGLWFVDLDGDGKLDAITSIATAGFIGTYVTFRNTSTPGSVSFEAPEYWQGATDESPISFIADLDGDGRPDMMSGEGAIPGSFWFNQNISTPGNIEFGSWIAPFGLSVLNGFKEANVADLNGDGKPELIIANGQGQAIDVLQNASTPGAPAFIEAFQFTTNQYNGSLVIADMNVDGKNDLLYKVSGEVGFHIRLNSDTDGTLTAADFASNLIITGDLSGQGGISIADMNGDGKPDIVASDNTDFGVFENVFSGGVFDVNSLVPAYQYEAPGLNTNPTPPIAVDLNGDGKPEIFAGITNAGTPDKFTIYENVNIVAPLISLNTVSPLSGPVGSTVTITGSNFSTVTTENIAWFGSVKAMVLTATANQLTVTVPPGAGYAPVSVTKAELTSTYHLPFQTTFSSGVTFDNTHFAPPVQFTLTNADYDIVVSDLDDDGLPDVVAEGTPLSGLTSLFRNTHTSGPISATSLTLNGTISSVHSPRLEDIDGDGLIDMMGARGTVHKNNSTTGNISFLAGVSITNVDGFLPAFADFNRDGKTDIVVTAGSLSVTMVENRTTNLTGNFTTGTFSSFAPGVVVPRPAATGTLVTGDFDNDGYKDMITTNPTIDNISFFRNAQRPRANATSFTANVELTVGDNPQFIYTGDFDRDGKLDVLVQHGAGTTSTLLILFQNASTVGNISFNRIDLTNPSATTTATVADLDGDGKPEIITTSESGNRFSIFKNLHTTGALTAASFTTPFNTTVTAPRGITTGDLNLDSKPEIIITRAAGLLLIYENLISSGPTITINPQPSPIAVCDGVTTSFTLTATGTTNLTYQWQKFDGSVFNNVSNGGGYSGTTTATLGINTTGNFGAGDYRCLIKGDLAPDKFSNIVTLTVNVVPAAPTANGNSNCVPAAITLTASGGTNGQYRWYDAGGVIIAAQVNSTYVTPVISTTTNYSVAINNGSCESTKTSVTATIQPLAKPTLNSSVQAVGGTINICAGDALTITAPSGFTTYTWSNGASTNPITITASTTALTLQVANGGCTSPLSDPLNIIVNPYPVATITPNDTQLTASSGDSYQWYQNSDLVNGATSQTFEYNVLEYGTYVVDVTDNGCTSTSDEFIYLVTDAEKTVDGLRVYPNPVTSKNLFITSSENATLKMFDILGRKVKEVTVTQGLSPNIISVHELNAGNYIIAIQSARTTTHVKIKID